MGFAAPRRGSYPMVFDQASSAMANGDVQIARREGRQLPPGTGIDREGKPTTDPNAVLEGGALLPFGGHKGATDFGLNGRPRSLTCPGAASLATVVAPSNWRSPGTRRIKAGVGLSSVNKIHR